MLHTQRTICQTHLPRLDCSCGLVPRLFSPGNFRAALCHVVYGLVAKLWPVLVHLRVIVHQLAVQCKPRKCYESQSRQLKNEGEKIFRASRGRISYHGTLPLPLAVAVPLQNCFLLRACTLCTPFNIPRSVPAGRDVWAC